MPEEFSINASCLIVPPAAQRDHERLAPLIPPSTERETCKHRHLLYTKAFQLFLKLKQKYYNNWGRKHCELPAGYFLLKLAATESHKLTFPCRQDRNRIGLG